MVSVVVMVVRCHMLIHDLCIHRKPRRIIVAYPFRNDLNKSKNKKKTGVYKWIFLTY